MRTYNLSMPPDAVRKRLEEAADRPSIRYWVLPGTTRGRPVIGEVRPDEFWWRLRHDERATFAPWVSGQIFPRPPGSTVVITVHSPLTRKARTAMAVAVLLLAALWLGVTPEKSLTSVLVAAASIACVIFFPLLGTWLLRDDERRLREQFEQTFSEAIEDVADL